MLLLDTCLPDGISESAIVLLVLVAFAAGWVDAVVGGGGLLQLPALLLVPGLSPVQALATNKMGSIFGTATSSVTYYRRVRPDLRTAIPMALIACAASFGGAALATALPASVFKPIIVVALVVVLIFTVARKQVGLVTRLKHDGARHYALAGLIGAVIGFYDGLIGPGTGSFLVIALVSVLGYSFLDGSAKAKIVNLATTLGALALFVPTGHVLWGIGLLLGVGPPLLHESTEAGGVTARARVEREFAEQFAALRSGQRAPVVGAHTVRAVREREHVAAAGGDECRLGARRDLATGHDEPARRQILDRAGERRCSGDARRVSTEVAQRRGRERQGVENAGGRR